MNLKTITIVLLACLGLSLIGCGAPAEDKPMNIQSANGPGVPKTDNSTSAPAVGGGSVPATSTP